MINSYRILTLCGVVPTTFRGYVSELAWVYSSLCLPGLENVDFR